MKIFLSGAGGFAGAHCLEHVLSVTDWDVACTDSFRHKGKTDRIAEVLHGHPEWRARTDVLTHDLTAPLSEQAVHRLGHVDCMIAMASESHVERSITSPVTFVLNNAAVALHTLQAARRLQPRVLVLISTDEVYGPEPIVAGVPQPHREWSTILPSNPYSASKAAQEAIGIAYWRTYGVPVVIVNCMNLIGERQDAEKFVPMLIAKISRGETVTIYGSETDVGTRHYLHARNLADAVAFIVRGQPPAMFPAHAANGTVVCDRPDRWNVVGPDRISNLDLAQMVAKIIGKPLRFEFLDFHTARPGHDAHYGLDPAKLTAAGWKPPVALAESLERTVNWTLAHPEWMLPDGPVA